MIRLSVEQVNPSPKIAKRNKSHDSTSSSRPLGFDATVGNSENPQTVASAERESEATEILPAPQSHYPPIENQEAGEPQPRSRSSSVGGAEGGSQGRSGGKHMQEGEGTPPRHGKEGPMDGTDLSPKKRGLLSIICPCFG